MHCDYSHQDARSPRPRAGHALCARRDVPVRRGADYDASNVIDIDAFGAIADNTTHAAAVINGRALFDALNAANSSFNGSRTVLIAAGRNYYMLPHGTGLGFQNLVDVTLALEGAVWAWTEDYKLWPAFNDSTLGINLFEFTHCRGVSLVGHGTVQGQGYWWWWYVIVTGIDNRPFLFHMYGCSDVYFVDWTLMNSPSFHIYLECTQNAFLHNITVHVDVEDQAALLAAHGHMTTGAEGLPGGIPTFPLNTDGIDISGVNITVTQCRIQNFDDAVCLKPLNTDEALTCTEDVLFEDIDITYGVGASVGSVGPGTNTPCIRNCTFRGISFHTPIKAIYVKPNPGDVGNGIIDRITYENVVSHGALWWSIWVSTQQEHQPGNGSNTHCNFFYPLFNSTCNTQPLVPVTNLVLRNITMTGALFSPGVMRCNASGPCTGWLFEDVSISSATDYPTSQFICAGIFNSTGINVLPSTAACFNGDAAATEHAEASPIQREVEGARAPSDSRKAVP